MKKITRALTSAISAAFAVSSIATESDKSVENTEVSGFQGLFFDGQANSDDMPMYLAAHKSHSSHGSHGSHRSSSGSSPRPAPIPNYPAPTAPKPAPKQEKKSDPLGQQAKPVQTYKPAIPDLPELKNNASARAAVIRRVQLVLMIQGDYDGSIDGVMGPKTRDAIDLYKIKRGLQRGGYLDKATLDALGVPVSVK